MFRLNLNKIDEIIAKKTNWFLETLQSLHYLKERVQGEISIALLI